MIMKDRNRQYILELFKIVSPKSILVVDQYGKVKRLHCPFRVLAIVDIPPDIAKEKFYMVDLVKMTLELKEVFIIQNKGYYICNFRIV
jgi:hypothetical protein